MGSRAQGSWITAYNVFYGQSTSMLYEDRPFLLGLRFASFNFAEAAGLIFFSVFVSCFSLFKGR
jgi:hypothetical protein